MAVSPPEDQPVHILPNAGIARAGRPSIISDPSEGSPLTTN
jgi:hypothetical protein